MNWVSPKWRLDHPLPAFVFSFVIIWLSTQTTASLSGRMATRRGSTCSTAGRQELVCEEVEFRSDSRLRFNVLMEQKQTRLVCETVRVSTFG